MQRNQVLFWLSFASPITIFSYSFRPSTKDGVLDQNRELTPIAQTKHDFFYYIKTRKLTILRDIG